MNDHKENWPMGMAQELEARKEVAPAIEVKNHVIEVNENFPDLPMDLKEGASTKLGMFLTPRPSENEPSYPLGVKKGHGRSGLWGRLLFKDRDGNLYRDIDLKGIGYTVEKDGAVVVDDDPRGYRITQKPDNHKVNLGILDLVSAVSDQTKSEEFISKGIRTHRVIAIIALEEIVEPNGKRISIEDAKRLGLIWHDSQPVLEVRAFGTNARLGDEAHNKLLLEDARLLVSSEFNFDPEKFNDEQYIDWLLEITGKNLGLLHKNGFVHGFLTRHNITLDGRLVDLDSAHKLDGAEGAEKIKEDIDDATSALTRFLESVGSTLQDKADIFRSAYEKSKK